MNWEFLLDKMNILGFGDLWIGWMKECITSALLSILVNGSTSKEFNIHQGLRQGDPLSPFLYLIVEEGLSRFFTKACEEGKFKPMLVGIKASRFLTFNLLMIPSLWGIGVKRILRPQTAC